MKVVDVLGHHIHMEPTLQFGDRPMGLVRFGGQHLGAAQVQLVGQVVGSADILAQMADRYYLESLSGLYREQCAGGVCRHVSALDLMKKTRQFYNQVVLPRLDIAFSRISAAMRTHFRLRHNIDRDLYLENIDKNIAYLEAVIATCGDSDCFARHLKRLPPAT